MYVCRLRIAVDAVLAATKRHAATSLIQFIRRYPLTRPNKVERFWRVLGFIGTISQRLETKSKTQVPKIIHEKKII